MTTPRKRKTAENNGQLLDGTLSIEVRGGPHDGKTLQMDALVVKAVADKLVAKHELVVKDGRYDYTAEFAIEFDQKLKDVGYDSTPTIALYAWVKAVDYFITVQKKTNESPS